MSATDVIKEWKKRNPQIENIVLFVCNALRWDYAPESVLSRGIAFKTIASGIMTCASFPSIITGLYPQHHGVHSFHGRIPKGTSSLLKLYGYNTSLWTGNILGFDPPESALLYRLLRHRNRVSLEDLDPPFIYLEDHRGGHCPYGWSADDEEYEPWDCMSFFRDFGIKGERALRKRYQEGIQISAREFDDRMRVIDERGLADETLVVFLSDHGELLGKRGGVVGHGNITVPEVVYVPTVFIHSDLPKGKSFEQEGVLRHVDLYPTICDLLGRRVTTKVSGVSLLDVKKLPHLGFTYFMERRKRARLNYEIKEASVWDKDGGFMFREGNSLPLLLFRAFYVTALCKTCINAIYRRQRLRRSPKALKNYIKLLKYFCSSFTKYGSPSFSLEKAKFFVKQICKSRIEDAKKERIKRIVNKLKSEGKI